jgi:UPF0755 protein
MGAYLEANRDRLETSSSDVYEPVVFVVEPGTPARMIAQNLVAEGLINDARLFEAYVRVNGLAQGLEAGTYTLSADMTIIQIAEILQHAVAPSVAIGIPEGWRLEQVAEELKRSTELDGEHYLALATTGADLDLSYPFLADRPTGATLEGYLFPDTYRVLKDGATPEDLLTSQLDAFAARVIPLYEEAVAHEQTALSLHEVLTVASIVEREAVIDEERPLIAGVYLNRLDQGMKLEADPTVQYAMGYQAGSGQWWKTPVTLEEYGLVNSPYNTYLYPGLPLGPIASPGLGSIEAVLNPDQHDFLYFVAIGDGSGRHVFSRTFEEHAANVREYLGR